MFDNNPEFLTAADDRRLELAARAAALIVDDGMSWAEARERITGICGEQGALSVLIG